MTEEAPPKTVSFTQFKYINLNNSMPKLPDSPFDSSHTTYITKAESNKLLEDRNRKEIKAADRRMERYATQLEMLAQLITLDLEAYKGTELGDVLKGYAITLENLSRDMSYNFNFADPRGDPLSKCVDDKWVLVEKEERKTNCYQVPRFTRPPNTDDS